MAPESVARTLAPWSPNHGPRAGLEVAGLDVAGLVAGLEVAGLEVAGLDVDTVNCTIFRESGAITDKTRTRNRGILPFLRK